VKTHRHLRWVLLLTLLFTTLALAAPLTEQQKIDALIHSVEVLPGAQFIRNGSVHDGKAAAEHLQMKRHYAGSRIKTADDFIECCASRSSFSGLPYQIRFANGQTVNADVFFRAELKRIEASSAQAPPPFAPSPLVPPH